MIVISPHLDDAVLSCGQALAARPGSIVVTILAGVPEALPVTDYDVRSGFTSATQAVEGRRAEDRRACAVLGADPIHLDYYDRQYARLNDEASMADTLVGILAELDGDIVGPLGLMHEDHVAVHRITQAAAETLGRPAIYYEELPTRVLWPEVVDPAAHLRPVVLPAGDLEIKEAAIACYRSQAWALNRHACLVPERFWS